MSNSKKITELTSYTAAEVKSTDPLFITDLTNQETKKITSLDFATYAITAKSSSIYNGNYNGTFTGSFSGSLTGTSTYAVTASYALTGGTGGSSGEVNTATNIGTSGIGLFKQKSGVDLQFKNISAGSNVSLTDDTVNNAVQINLTSTLTPPGGSTGTIQFNANGSVFSGNSNLSWDTTTNDKLTVVGNVTSTNFSSSITNAVGYFGTASFSVSSSNSRSSSFATTSTTSSYATTSNYATTASYVSTPNGILNVYNEVFSTAATTNVIYPIFYSGSGAVHKTVTPTTSTSKFLINISVNISVFNGSGYGYASLFKDNTLLVDRFVWSDGGITVGGSVTYVDTATDLSTRTYWVKYSTNGGDTIYLNSYYGTYTMNSTLSILELNL